jgi:hypothetical protein
MENYSRRSSRPHTFHENVILIRGRGNLACGERHRKTTQQENQAKRKGMWKLIQTQTIDQLDDDDRQNGNERDMFHIRTSKGPPM